MFKAIDGDNQERRRLVIIQCDSGQMTGDLIACARYRIYDLKAKAAHNMATHVLFVIHLPRNNANSSFVGFQGDPWLSYHIDDLRPTNSISVSVKDAITRTISELFVGSGIPSRNEDCSEDCLNSEGDISPLEPAEMRSTCTFESKTASHRRLHGCIQAAASRLKDTTKRCTQRIALLVRLVPKVSLSRQGMV
jgi:hypothetical protein